MAARVAEDAAVAEDADRNRDEAQGSLEENARGETVARRRIRLPRRRLPSTGRTGTAQMETVQVTRNETFCLRAPTPREAELA